jgi:hypothetical protein
MHIRVVLAWNNFVNGGKLTVPCIDVLFTRLKQTSPLLARCSFVVGVLSRPAWLTLAIVQSVAGHVHAVDAIDGIARGLCRDGAEGDQQRGASNRLKSAEQQID